MTIDAWVADAATADVPCSLDVDDGQGHHFGAPELLVAPRAPRYLPPA